MKKKKKRQYIRAQGKKCMCFTHQHSDQQHLQEITLANISPTCFQSQARLHILCTSTHHLFLNKNWITLLMLFCSSLFSNDISELYAYAIKYRYTPPC